MWIVREYSVVSTAIKWGYRRTYLPSTSLAMILRISKDFFVSVGMTAPMSSIEYNGSFQLPVFILLLELESAQFKLATIDRAISKACWSLFAK